ncbi:MAG: type II toxin-antitoxin system PemK/MazF family toxin [Nitrospiraceae bacterium]|nr:type II toxin-antitoxin system PemK/MazF family toxin [Nitrospiraceae bacterium]
MGAAPARGDIILLSLNPTLGHEQAGTRPAVVLSPELYNKASGLCLVCPVTTQVKGYPFEVPLEGTKKITGVALADQIRSIDWQARKIRDSARCRLRGTLSNLRLSDLAAPGINREP